MATLYFLLNSLRKYFYQKWPLYQLKCFFFLTKTVSKTSQQIQTTKGEKNSFKNPLPKFINISPSALRDFQANLSSVRIENNSRLLVKFISSCLQTKHILLYNLIKYLESNNVLQSSNMSENEYEVAVRTNDPLLFNSLYKFALQSLGVCNLISYWKSWQNYPCQALICLCSAPCISEVKILKR